MTVFLVTGGAGFIGSALCRRLVANPDYRVVNVDSLTYAANLASLASVEGRPNYRFVRADIGDRETMLTLLRAEQVDIVIHLAAETHVDRSIDGPAAFINTNVVGTSRLLDATLAWSRERGGNVRFHHVSTDEVYGDLPFDGGLFTETTAYSPRSPYSASKAASDHLVRAWHHTYGLPVVVSNCSNNYGSCQFPEKLIPLTILNALEGKPLPVYGTGANVRDWLYVDDHVRALELIATRGEAGETYNVGGGAERTNLAVVETICDLVDARVPRAGQPPRRKLIQFVTDRPGHDRRYAIDASKIGRELGWTPSVSFDEGLAATVDWYLGNEGWWGPIRRERYAGERLGKA